MPIFVSNAGDNKNDELRKFDDLDADAQELIKAATEARAEAYVPYSNFKVGAAVRTADGTIYKGCNIENASYPAGICAERVAAGKAISEGKRKFTGIALVAQMDPYCTPCGVCRQFLAEFAAQGDFPVYMAQPCFPPLQLLVMTISQLLPRSFKL